MVIELFNKRSVEFITVIKSKDIFNVETYQNFIKKTLFLTIFSIFASLPIYANNAEEQELINTAKSLTESAKNHYNRVIFYKGGSQAPQLLESLIVNDEGLQNLFPKTWTAQSKEKWMTYLQAIVKGEYTSQYNKGIRWLKVYNGFLEYIGLKVHEIYSAEKKMWNNGPAIPHTPFDHWRSKDR